MRGRSRARRASRSFLFQMPKSLYKEKRFQTGSDTLAFFVPFTPRGLLKRETPRQLLAKNGGGPLPRRHSVSAFPRGEGRSSRLSLLYSVLQCAEQKKEERRRRRVGIANHDSTIQKMVQGGRKERGRKREEELETRMGEERREQFLVHASTGTREISLRLLFIYSLQFFFWGGGTLNGLYQCTMLGKGISMQSNGRLDSGHALTATDPKSPPTHKKVQMAL